MSPDQDNEMKTVIGWSMKNDDDVGLWIQEEDLGGRDEGRERERQRTGVIGDFEGRRKRNVISRRLQYAKGIGEGCRGHQRYGNIVIADYRQKWETGHINGKCGEEVMNNKMRNGNNENSYTPNLQRSKAKFVAENT